MSREVGSRDFYIVTNSLTTNCGQREKVTMKKKLVLMKKRYTFAK